jgi:hypothetical protein
VFLSLFRAKTHYGQKPKQQLKKEEDSEGQKIE